MKNLILTGFMGVGKSTIGRQLARNLSMNFIDMDQVLELRIAKTIPAFFAEQGESAFRQLETALCEEFATLENTIIATGGGTFIDPHNQAIFLANPLNHILVLHASLDTIRSRITLAEQNQRPLFDDNLEQRFNQRQPIYAALPYHIHTDHKSVAQICAEIQSLFNFTQLTIHTPSNQYPIYIGNHIINHLSQWLVQAGFSPDTKLCLITDSTVNDLHAQSVITPLTQAGYQVTSLVMPTGEQHKTIQTVLSLIDQMIAHQFDRHTLLIALGGGIVTDLAGFTAATFMRGIPHIQIPTSLLAMVDASIGGKTGVNLPQGKNLLGAFKQPEAVLMDVDFLQTLPEVERVNGLAEAIKHGIIASPSLFNFFEENAGDWPTLLANPDWIVDTIQVKKQIVEQDPYEKNIRAYLNLGHTAGHAIEKQSHFDLKHGQAVAIGILIAAQLSLITNFLSLKEYNRIQSLLQAWGLPITADLDPQIVYQTCQVDKKKQGATLRWVLPQAIGKVQISQDISDAQALAAITAVLQK
jgi:3-dehydroquinate synthase